MLRSARWTSIVAFLLICLPCVQATADQQRDTDEPAAGGPALCYDAWVLEMEPAYAKRVLGRRQPYKQRPARRLADCPARWLLDQMTRGSGGRVTHKTRGCIGRGRPGRVEERHVFTYIQDFDVEVAQDEFIADPVVGSLPWGVDVGLHMEVAGELEIRANFTRLVQPVPNFETRIIKGRPPVVIQLPELRLQGLKAKLRVKPGDWLLVGDSRELQESDGRVLPRRYVLLHFTPVEPARAQVMTDLVFACVPAASLPPAPGAEAVQMLSPEAGASLLTKWRADKQANIAELPSVIASLGDEQTAYTGPTMKSEVFPGGEVMHFETDLNVCFARTTVTAGDAETLRVTSRVAWRPGAEAFGSSEWPLLRLRASWQQPGDQFVLLKLGMPNQADGEACVCLVRVRKMGDDEPRAPSNFTPPEDPDSEAK